ncbi:priA: primosomal protein N' [Gaiella occulta]|uniref:Replication restart protein PriA n=1 Tax=Gaiella occulta TaxID=1002870 RepID=A0A7M2YVS7_9ACTN|nr:primosomal protein N' [Gaiella occulta]RDI73830.1 priA: primosomal protein N' [Gaiella occulta]
MPLASVYPLVSTRALARPFTYEVPDGVGKGAVVAVRLGRSSTRGVVAEVGVEAPSGISPAAVGKVLDRIPPPLVDLALWIADYYGSTPARALELVAPLRRAPRGTRPSPAERESLAGEPEPGSLTGEQRTAVARITTAFDEGCGAHLLLVGPTGSGKTEVYLQACAAALERGLGTIVLVPEIALAPQTVGRFRERFGDTVAIMHSALGEAERRDERDRIASGEARIVVGARSAVFAPMRGVGLIVVDEEHDAAFKQESDPRYDARTVAAKRAALEGAVAVYGSATPRPESWARLERIELSVRIGAPMPRVRLVDLRREAGYPLSAPLLAELGRLADRGGKAILLLNRRGVAPALHCRACGVSRRCGSCDVALTLHRDGRLHCHHCGFSEPVPEACPACGSSQLAQIGAGTQRLETELERHVPELERIRLDADTAAEPGALRATIERFRAADRAVLIGTQMVAKGHHFAGVELAAVVDADTGLALPDFRAEERTFQLVTQLAGRSGRDAPGLVLVQTFQPEATPLRFAQRHDVAGFLAEEIERRAALAYPPLRHLVTVVASGPDASGPARLLREVREGLASVDAQVLGPAPLLRLRGRHRAQLVAKTSEPRRLARQAAALLAAAGPALRKSGLTAVVDVDPQSL